MKSLRHPRFPAFCAIAFAIGLCCAGSATAQNDDSTTDGPLAPHLPALEPDLLLHPVAPAKPPVSPLSHDRILGVIPDYQTVQGGSAPPLTVGQKWDLALKETIDPFNLCNAGIGAVFSQAGNETPKYGQGRAAFGKRYGAALADMSTQNFFSAGVLATVLHQDPRYFRMGPQAGVPRRILYSVSRLVIARQDSGRAAFNASGIFGMMLGIAASNLYYPSASISTSVMANRLNTSLLGGVTGNLMSEFWPDIQKKFFHRGARAPRAASRPVATPGVGTIADVAH